MVEVAICNQVAEYWDKLEHLIKPIEKYSGGRMTAEDVFFTCEAGTTQLWVMAVDHEFVAIGLTEVRDNPNLTAFRVLFLGGSKLKEWLPMFVEKGVEYAKYNHCRIVEIMGRKGWLKVLAPFGFKPTGYHPMELRVDG